MNIHPKKRSFSKLLLLVTFILHSTFALSDKDTNLRINKVFISGTNEFTIRMTGPYEIKNSQDIDIVSNTIQCKKFIESFIIQNVKNNTLKEDDCFGEIENRKFVSVIKLHLSNTFDQTGTYSFQYPGSKTCEEKSCITLERDFRIIGARKLAIYFKKNEIIVQSDSELNQDYPYKVKVYRKNKPIKSINKYINVLKNGNHRVSIFLPFRLISGDVVSVETIDPIGKISGKKEFTYSYPKNIEDSIQYLSLSLDGDDNRDQKYQFSFKYKYDNSKELVKLHPGKFGKPSPIVDIDLNNKYEEAKQKATIKLLWSMYASPKTDTVVNYSKQRFHDIGFGFELEDNLKNNNVIFSYLQTYKTSIKSALTPSFGIDLGQNLSLTDKVKSLGGEDNYNIARAVLNLKYSYVKEIENCKIDSITFSLSNKLRYLLTDELHVQTIKGNGDDIKDVDDYFLDKGLREFWEAEVIFGLSDRLGLSLNYENGKEPQFYRDEDKISLSLVYSY